MKKLAIFGASGHGKVVADIALAAGWDIIDFYDDAWPNRLKNAHWPIVGNYQTLLQNHKQYQSSIVAIGDNAIRLKIAERLNRHNLTFATLIHPSAVISPYSTVAAGTVIMAGVVINIDTHIGGHCIINTGATIDHDCRIDHGVHLSPGVHLAGNVHVMQGAWIGIGAGIIQQKCVGKGATVAAGATVIHTIADDVTVAGTPATIITKQEVTRA